MIILKILQKNQFAKHLILNLKAPAILSKSFQKYIKKNNNA